MNNKLKNTILEIFKDVYSSQNDGEKMELIDEDSILLECGIDSLGFAIVVTKLEAILGYDPFTISSDPYYPQTFGEFVKFYDKHKPDDV